MLVHNVTKLAVNVQALIIVIVNNVLDLIIYIKNLAYQPALHPIMPKIIYVMNVILIV